MKNQYKLCTGAFLKLIVLSADKNLNNKKKWENKVCNFKESNLLERLLKIVYFKDGLLEDYDSRAASTSVGELKRGEAQTGKYYPFKKIKPYINKHIENEYDVFYNNTYDFIENTLSLTDLKEIVIPTIIEIFKSYDNPQIWFNGKKQLIDYESPIDIPAFFLGAWIYCIDYYKDNVIYISKNTIQCLENIKIKAYNYLPLKRKDVSEEESLKEDPIVEEPIAEEPKKEIFEGEIVEEPKENTTNQTVNIGFVFNGTVNGGNFAQGDIYINGKEEKKDE